MRDENNNMAPNSGLLRPTKIFPSEADEINPWKTTGSRLVYSNAWIKLREDSVITPAGKESIYGVVETKIACAVVALTEDREIYLVGQYRYPVETYSWEVIEGGAEHGEDPLEASKRELKEEAGLVAKNWVQLGPEIHLSNCFSEERGLIFCATDLTVVQAEPEDVEILKVRKVALTTALEMMRSGEIQDAFSLIALQRAEDYILQKSRNPLVQGAED